MQDLIRELAELIGVNPALLDGSALTLALLALVYMVRALLQTQRTDEKQVGFEQQLVKMAADSAEDSRQNLKAYEANAEAICVLAQVTAQAIKDNSQSIRDNAQATKESSLVSQELVRVVKDLTKTFPERIAAHEDATVKLFMDKADEMHSVTVRRDTEMADDRVQRELNQKELLGKLEEQRTIIQTIVRELTDDTDVTTLRYELNSLVRKFDEILAGMSLGESTENGSESVGSTVDNERIASS